MKQATLFNLESRERFERWAAFHRANPGVYELFRRFAVQALEKGGRRRFGARMIGERIRWYTAIETTDVDFKVNDHYWPYYARLLMLTEERFAGFFERRDTRFDVEDEEILEVAHGV